MQQTRTIWTIIKEGHIRIIPVKLSFEAIVDDLFVFVALHAKSTAMVMAGRSVHLTTLLHGQAWTSTSADPEGDLDPPGKSQVIWVSIGNKQLDPPAKRWTPPLENVGPPLEPWKMIVFFEINYLTSIISWGLKKIKKKKHIVRAFLSDWPGSPLTKIPGSAHEAVNQYLLHILSLVTDNNPYWMI